jgi:D-alanine-D-alanine ligase
MSKKLKIGIAYDVKSDYQIDASDWKYSDFSTLREIDFIKSQFEKRGHTVYLLGNYEKIYRALKLGTFPPVDIVFNTAEGIGSRNREGWIPSLLEINNIPYSGSDAFALSVSLSKLHTKIIAQYLHIPTPLFLGISSTEDIINALSIPGPWVLKPNFEGSSSGVIYVESKQDLYKKAEFLLTEYQQPLVCESYISGREANVSLLYDGEKTKVIGAVEVVRKSGEPLHIFNAMDKFGGTCTKINAAFTQSTLNSMYESATRLHKHLGCKDYNRADFRIDENGKPYFLELNPTPGISEDDSFTLCCEYHNYRIDWVLEQIIINALKRLDKKTYS